MKTIRIVTSNFFYTPASLMLRFARENVDPLHDKAHPWGFKYGRDGKLFLRNEGIYYTYDHWEIKPVDDLLDDVTIYLKEVAKEDTI